MSKDTDNSQKLSELEWVEIREIAEVGPMGLSETSKEKLFRKVKENPLVPMGCTLTVAALCYGLVNFYRRNSQMSQYMMRARVAAQAFTFVAILVGVSMSTQDKRQ